MPLGRVERLQIMLTDDELAAIDDWRFKRRMPSRAAAIREMLKRGLAAEGFTHADRDVKSKDFGVVLAKQKSGPERRSQPKTSPET
jgi:metal-responsive CopG/Arc/MetJ family transcriptional regulator